MFLPQEAGCDGRCQLDGLVFDFSAPNIDRVETDGSASKGFVGVSDLPACALEWFESAGFGGIEYRMAKRLLRCWETRAEDPQVG